MRMPSRSATSSFLVPLLFCSIVGLLVRLCDAIISQNLEQTRNVTYGSCELEDLPDVLLSAVNNRCYEKNKNHFDIELSDSIVMTKPTFYTAHDDASWAITSSNLSNHILGSDRQAYYDDFIRECIQLFPGCALEDAARIDQNKYQPPGVINYTEMGFQKVRAPESLWTLLKEFWDRNRDKIVKEWDDATAYHNTWRVPTSFLSVEDDSLLGGGFNLSAAIWNSARTVLEQWTGQKLSGSSVYGIRLYHDGAILAPHVDRIPLISSCIINVDQDVDEDWVLEVYGHDGKATNVTMKPGDMVLYESHSVIHGRPFPLKGRFFANIFVHFQPMGDYDSLEKLPEIGGLAPWIKPGSDWEEDYWDDFPMGWDLLTDIINLVQLGDLYTLRYIAQRDRDRLTDPQHLCQYLTLAILRNHLDVVDFLLGEMIYPPNMTCGIELIQLTPLDVAQYTFKDDQHPMVHLISEKYGGVSYDKLWMESDPIAMAEFGETCQLFANAIFQNSTQTDNKTLSQLLEKYTPNRICGRHSSPWDWAQQPQVPDDIRQFLGENGAFSYDELFYSALEASYDDDDDEEEEGGDDVDSNEGEDNAEDDEEEDDDDDDDE